MGNLADLFRAEEDFDVSFGKNNASLDMMLLRPGNCQQNQFEDQIPQLESDRPRSDRINQDYASKVETNQSSVPHSTALEEQQQQL